MVGNSNRVGSDALGDDALLKGCVGKGGGGGIGGEGLVLCNVAVGELKLERRILLNHRQLIRLKFHFL